jgi:outer membrane immunogenic protein
VKKLAVCSIALIGTPALAADLPVKAPPPPSAPVWSWTGFYVGGNVGYSVGRDPTDLANPSSGSPAITPAGVIDLFKLAPAGGLGGGQIGYNWQTGNLVLGLEGDWQWTHQTDSACVQECSFFFNTASALNYQQTLTSFGTGRARIGFADDRSFWYVTAGGAWGQVEDRFSFLETGPGLVISGGTIATHNKGGFVVGGGVETALAGPWSAKLEYLYLDLGGVTDAFTTTNNVGANNPTFVANSTVRDQIIRFGLNYRFGQTVGFDNVAPAVPRVAPVDKDTLSVARTSNSWTGFYVGGNAGYGFGRNPSETSQIQPPLSAVIESFKLAPAGFVGGPQIGVNWQTGNLVLGAEADWQWGNQTDFACLHECNGVFNQDYDQSLKWFATTRARIGFARDGWLWYATGGSAWGQVENTFTLFSGPLNIPLQGVNASHDRSGFVVGGGVETALAGPWSAKLEYLYMNLGSVTDSFSTGFAGATFSTTTDIRDHIVRVGLNYRFGGPVIANYGPL